MRFGNPEYHIQLATASNSFSGRSASPIERGDGQDVRVVRRDGARLYSGTDSLPLHVKLLLLALSCFFLVMCCFFLSLCERLFFTGIWLS